MTTIAWDGRTLAADRGCANGEMFFETNKMRVFEPGQIVRPGFPAGCWAHTGTVAFRMAVIHWLTNLEAERPMPAKDDSIDDCIGIWATGGTCYLLFSRLVLLPIRGRFHAEGRGRSFAMGTMAAGATAEEAVRLAAIHTDASAMGVDTWRPT